MCANLKIDNVPEIDAKDSFAMPLNLASLSQLWVRILICIVVI